PPSVGPLPPSDQRPDLPRYRRDCVTVQDEIPVALAGKREFSRLVALREATAALVCELLAVDHQGGTRKPGHGDAPLALRPRQRGFGAGARPHSRPWRRGRDRGPRV